MRVVLFLFLALVIFVSVNLITVRALLRIHPRRRRLVIAAAVLGNLMWPFMPALNLLNSFMRIVRALIGPLWFAWNSFAILYAAMLAAAAVVWLTVGRKQTFHQLARWPSRVFLALALAGGGAGLQQALVPIRIERVPVELQGLPAEADGMRLVLMADLHVGLFTRLSRLERLFAMANDLDPHVVLLLGDLVDDDPFFVPKLLAGTRSLEARIPLFGVLGNHEVYGDPDRFIEATQGSRIQMLVNRGASLGPLWLAGVSDPAAAQRQSRTAYIPDLARALSGRPAASFPVVISHQPRIFYEARQKGLPLVLSGHTHGGQCGVRPLGWSLAGVFLEYHMGLYRWRNSQLYINTGTGYWLVPFRLGMTPEITLIELRRKRR